MNDFIRPTLYNAHHNVEPVNLSKSGLKNLILLVQFVKLEITLRKMHCLAILQKVNY